MLRRRAAPGHRGTGGRGASVPAGPWRRPGERWPAWPGGCARLVARQALVQGRDGGRLGRMSDGDKAVSRRTLIRGAVAGAAILATGLGARAEEPAVGAPGKEPEPAPKPPPRPPRMPVAFVGHGSPMLALDAVRGREFHAWAESMGRPVAVLVVSAHYERRPVTLGATRTLPLIYDFRGFPPALYQVRYAPPGAPRLARRVAQALAPLGPVAEQPDRGLDHGAWVPLKWMYPGADVPVLPVSLPSHDPRALLALGRALGPLRDEGVLILGSGSLTHNLRRLDGRPGAPTPAWAADFDAWVSDVLARRAVDELLDWEQRAPAARTNHPTVEHFVPLILAEGARRTDDAAAFPITGFDAASISRRCVTFAPPAPPARPAPPAAPAAPVRPG